MFTHSDQPKIVLPCIAPSICSGMCCLIRAAYKYELNIVYMSQSFLSHVYFIRTVVFFFLPQDSQDSDVQPRLAGFLPGFPVEVEAKWRISVVDEFSGELSSLCCQSKVSSGLGLYLRPIKETKTTCISTNDILALICHSTVYFCMLVPSRVFGLKAKSLCFFFWAVSKTLL